MTKKVFFKGRQFLPGPTSVWLRGATDDLVRSTYHRSSEFKQTLLSVRKNLAPFFGTKTNPILFSSSGTGAMESAVVNLTNIADQVLVLSAGKFGERWVELCEAYDCQVHVLHIPWGEGPDFKVLEQKLKELPQLKACFLQGVETSTGVRFSIKKIGELVKKYTKAFTVVDAVTSLCSEKNEMDAWQVDCMIGGSQKGFGVSAGLSFFALSEYALDNLSQRPRFYFDYKKEFLEQEQGLTAWSSAVALVESLDFALKKIHDFGLESFIAQHSFIAQAVRKSLVQMGCQFFTKGEPSASVTAFYPPSGIKASELLKKLKGNYGVEFSGGQSQLKDKVLRIGHLGFLDPLDLVSAIAALEYALKDLGSSHKLGTGVSVFMEEYYKLALQ